MSSIQQLRLDQVSRPSFWMRCWLSTSTSKPTSYICVLKAANTVSRWEMAVLPFYALALPTQYRRVIFAAERGIHDDGCYDDL